MNNSGLTQEQFAALVQDVAKALVQTSILGKSEDGSAKSTVSSKRGRPKSKYTSQLHLRTLPKDSEWFKVTADELGVQQGELFSMLRRHFSEQPGPSR